MEKRYTDRFDWMIIYLRNNISKFVAFSVLTLVFWGTLNTEILALQANQTVRGLVTEAESGDPLPGVNVTVRGTTIGTTTNRNGNYELAVPSLQDTLVFSFVGYQTREISINGRTVIDITLQIQTLVGEELVVVGYGSQARRDVAGSVAQISSEDLDATGVNTSVDQMLEGKVSGVQVVQNSGEPGGGMSINIRGVGSINAGSSPLYVIDGLPIDNSALIPQTGNQVASNRSPRNPLSSLNPENIESIEILKDASATAIYGARGANGVILITTSKGHVGDLQVDYNGQFGIQNVHRRLDLLGPQEYMQGINSLIDAGLGETSERVTGIQGGGTDWQNVIFRENAPLQKHNLTFSWGNENTTYSVALNNTLQDGLVKRTSFERYGARFNLNHNTEKLNMGISATTSYIKDQFVPNGFDVNLRGGAINAAKLWDPTFPVRNESGDYAITDLFDIDNPAAIIEGNDMSGNRYRTFGTVYGEYFVVPNLALKLSVGGDINSENKTIYKDRTTIIGNSLGGVATAYEGAQSNYLIEGTANYQTTFDDYHSINALVGITTQKYITRRSTMQANNFITDATGAFNFSLADRSTVITDSFKQSNQLLSYLGRINYKYRDKYLLTASYRIDGSSRFGPGNKFGYFPSVAVGWLINQEDFFSSLEDEISMLKLRASWGKTGNQEIGNNQYLVTFASGNRTSYVLDDQFANSLNPTRIANPDLKWETTEQINIGLDFSLLQDRLTGSIEWYKKDTYDMLLDLPVPTSTGYDDRLVNIGSMENSGLEFALSSHNINARDFSWSTDLNFTTLKNEVTDLGGIPRILTGGFGAAAGNVSIIQPGSPLRSFFGHEVIGIWQEGDDFSAVSNSNQPGDFKFRDVNNDGIIDGDDRVILGDSFPEFQWGIGNALNYKNFQMYFFFRGVHGVEMLNGNLLENYFPRSGTRINRLAEPFLNRWTPSNPTNDYPSYLNIDQHGFGVNSHTVVDASYIKLQTVRLGYNVPNSILSGIARSAEVYVSGQNLLTISDYEGFDPSLNPNGTANFRVDWNGYPTATTYVIGLNIGF